MTDQSKISGRPIPEGMNETTSRDSHAGAAVSACADVLGQVMSQMSALLEVQAGAVPHVFACALGVVVGRVVAGPKIGPAILEYAEADLERFADMLATQVRENVLLSHAQAKGIVGEDNPDVLAAIREAAARGGAPLN